MDPPHTFYAVKVGRKPGIYTSWLECKEQIHCYSGACFKKFSTLKDANNFILKSKTKDSSSEPFVVGIAPAETQPIEAAFSIKKRKRDNISRITVKNEDDDNEEEEEDTFSHNIKRQKIQEEIEVLKRLLAQKEEILNLYYI